MMSVSGARLGRPSRRAVAFALAAILPWVCSAISQRVGWLHPIPMALQFLAMVLVASLGGLWPALLSVFFAVVSRALELHASNPAGLGKTDLLRAGVLLLAAVIICVICSSRVRSEERLEAALGDLRERTAALVESLNSSKCACWTVDLGRGDGVRWYSGSYPIFGRPFSEVEQLPSPLPLIHPEDQVKFTDLDQIMRSTWEPLVYEYRVPWPNGDVHWMEMRGTRVDGQSCLWRGVTVDITERKLTEFALLRAEKLAAMGRLASTVAHEINNPLEAVMNLMYLIGSDDALGETTRQYLASAERELGRLGNITRLTLGFVRNHERVSEVEIGTIVGEVVTILQHRLSAKNVQVECQCEPGLAIAIAPHELRQIVMNLLANAADAVPVSEGRVWVRAMAKGNAAVLTVEDNGVGVSASNMHRLFEPFFTTRQDVGTGIGLWVTKELVEKNSGHIAVESGEGLPAGVKTRFRVEFPAVRPAELVDASS